MVDADALLADKTDDFTSCSRVRNRTNIPATAQLEGGLLRHTTLRTAILLISAAGLLLAQRDMGTISGIVRDSSGAPIPNAQVTVAEIDKGTEVKTQTNSDGQYVATPLAVGRYQVSVQQQGFKTVVVGPIVLQVQQRAAADVVLTVGQLNQKVEVSAAAVALQTESASLGQVINSQEMVNLPLNGRNFAQLALLSAGVEPSEPGSRNQTTYGFAANGGRSLQNNFILDGIDNNSDLPDLFNSTSYAIQPSVEALQEFKVQTNAYSAEFGRGNGAVINATIKSGTNQLHGDTYEFIRNNDFDARNFFESSIPHYSQNQFGSTLGGPVVIPHVYNGRDHTFFFVDYEGLWISQGQDYSATVPTLAERGGNFQSLVNYTEPTGVLDCNGAPTYQGEIFNSRLTQRSASSPTGLCGVPFAYNAAGLPTNQISATQMDPLAARLVGLYPLPNASNPAFNYFVTPNLQEHQNNFDIRLDQHFNDKDSAFFRFSYENQPSLIPPLYPGYGDGGGFFSGDQVNAYKSVVLSETHTFTPNLVNEARVGYDRINSHRLNPNSNIDVSSALGFPGVPYGPSLGGLPFMTFSDVSQLGSAAYLPSIEKQNVYNYLDTVSWLRGKHALRFGAEIREEEVTFFQPPFPRGTLDFSPQFTDNPADPGTGGSGLASFMLGVSDAASITNAQNVDMLRHVPGVYIQDDFRVSSKFTLNLGVRWEYYSPPVERFNAQGNFNLATQTMIVPRGITTQLSPALSALIPLSATGSRGLVNPDYHDWAPRFGFAYKLTDRLVLRGGYGIFYGGEENGPYSLPLGYNPPFLNYQVYSTQCGAASANPTLGAQDCALPGLSVLANGFPMNALANPNTPSLTVYNQNLPTPYMQDWNMATQYQLPSHTLLTVAYAASKGTHLFTFPNMNQAAPTANPSIPYDVRRPYPNFDTGIYELESAVNSNYNALQVTAERQVGTGLVFLATYTWSHAICEGEASAGLGGNNNSSYRYSQDLDWEYGNCDFNVPQRLVLSYTYQLPFGRGRQWGSSMGRVTDAFFGQWQVNGITTFSEGQNFTVTDSNGNFANSDGSQRPDTIENPNSKPCVLGTLFNTCAFTDPPLGSFGNTGMNTVRGPGFQNWDFSLFKSFAFSERTRLQFRAEFFNIFNHTNPLLVAAGPQASIFTTAYGQPQFGYPAAAMPPRQIQFALKLYY